MDDSSVDSILWRRAVAHGDGFVTDPAWPPQPYAIPVPNPVLRESSAVAAVDAFYVIAESWAHMVAHFLPPAPAVLDVGCGCGKLARFLYMNPGLSYLGIDIFKPAVEWCRAAFAPLAGDRFRFEHYDGYSAVYNSTGKIKPSEYTFPCADESIDIVVCASLFTHLLLPDCIHYLEEIARVLKVGGRAIISLHTQPAPGERFSGDEARIDVDPRYFAELSASAGLPLADSIGRVYGQDVYVFKRA